jgi:serine/threonine-protein kinase RsbW
MAAETSVKLVLPSEIRLIDLVHAAAETLAGLVGFDEDEALNVGLAVREAVINAMLHGNRQDPALVVGVTLSTDAQTLTATVTDQGNGFDRDAAPDATAEANRLRDSGRGLLLMKAFVDQLSFRNLPEGGTEVTMVKRLPTADGGSRKGEASARG